MRTFIASPITPKIMCLCVRCAACGCFYALFFAYYKNGSVALRVRLSACSARVLRAVAFVWVHYATLRLCARTEWFFLWPSVQRERWLFFFSWFLRQERSVSLIYFSCYSSDLSAYSIRYLSIKKRSFTALANTQTGPDWWWSLKTLMHENKRLQRSEEMEAYGEKVLLTWWLACWTILVQKADNRRKGSFN